MVDLLNRVPGTSGLARSPAGASGFSAGTIALLAATGIVFLLFGAVLFLAPSWAADHFPWKVTPFTAMTIGGWYLASIVALWECARQPWGIAFPCWTYLAALTIGQTLIVAAYADVFHPGAALGWPYLVTLAVADLTVLAATLDLLRRRPPGPPRRPPLLAWMQAGILIFVVGVGFLGVVLLTGIAHGTSMWKSPLTPLTAHTYGLFYSGLTLGAISLLLPGGLPPLLSYARAGLALIIGSLIPAIVYHGQFDFQHRTAGVVYFAAYVIVGAALTLGLLRYGGFSDAAA